MIRKAKAIGTAVLSVAVCCSLAQGQSPSPTTLVIGLRDAVEYQGDISDPQQFATKLNLTPSVLPRNFLVATLLADIVSVNVQPAKGIYAGRSRVINLS